MATITGESSKPGFDASKHVPPTYDIGGHYNPPKISTKVAETFNNGINAKDVRIPESWIGPEPGKTRTSMKHTQKVSLVPDPSFDIDGDGVVGERDILISRMFDKNKDGILDKTEKTTAMQHLEQYHNKLAKKTEMKQNSLWGINRDTKNTYFRVEHKKRLMSDFKDHNKSSTEPPTKRAVYRKTMSDMKFNRRKADRQKLEELKTNWDLKNPSQETKSYIRSEFLVNNPSHTSINQINSEKKREIRRKAGLKEVADFSVDDKPPPTLSYLHTPSIPSKACLEDQRRKTNLTELKNLEKKQGNVEVGINRLMKKEEAVFSLGNANHRKTKEMIDERRRKEMLENNMRVFGNVSIGIHGKELPKYHHSMSEWWKNKRGFNENPKENSLLRFKQNTKYWAKDDNILL